MAKQIVSVAAWFVATVDPVAIAVVFSAASPTPDAAWMTLAVIMVSITAAEVVLAAARVLE